MHTNNLKIKSDTKQKEKKINLKPNEDRKKITAQCAQNGNTNNNNNNNKKKRIYSNNSE